MNNDRNNSGHGGGKYRGQRSGGGGFRGDRDNRGGGGSHGGPKGGGGYSGGGNRNDRGNQGGGRRFEGRDNRGNDRGGRRDDFRKDREHSGDRHGGGRPSSWVEVTGRTLAEAKEEAFRRYNASEDQMRIEVVEEGSRGFLGLGSKPARIKVALKPSAIQPFAEGVLSRVLRAMGLPDKVKRTKDSDGNPVLDVEGPSGGILIGRHGQTLESLQYLVSKIVQRVTGDDHALVVVDIEGYRERQTDKLKEMALGLAKKAAESGQEIGLQPMSSRERRVVHMALKDNAEVTTQSVGEGLRRRVMIVPKNKAVAPAPSTSTVDSTAPAAETAASQAVAETPSEPVPAVEPGNMAPREKEVDDGIGNRV